MSALTFVPVGACVFVRRDDTLATDFATQAPMLYSAVHETRTVNHGTYVRAKVIPAALYEAVDAVVQHQRDMFAFNGAHDSIYEGSAIQKLVTLWPVAP